MTTIAYKNGILAGDKQTNYGSLPGRTTKVRRLGKYLVGGCGHTARIHELHQWIEAGMDPAAAPPYIREDSCPTMMLIDEHGDIHLVDGSPYLVRIEQPFWAIGSGRDFALMAMHLGKSAPEAIALASEWDTATGMGVDTVALPGWGARAETASQYRDQSVLSPYLSKLPPFGGSLLQRQHLQEPGDRVSKL